MSTAMVLASSGTEQELKRRIGELERQLDEKTTLLKEIHHRVKNNLQVVCSLLSLQIDDAESDGVAGPLQDAWSRVLAMSLVHESIYQSADSAETLGEVNFEAYVESLTAQLFSAYCIDPARIQLEIKTEAVRIAADQAIPCGLILNELVSNALKHAFPNGREGIIRIALRRAGRGYVALSISDNGVGLPADFRWQESRSLGLRVVHTLIEQLRAELEVTSVGGTTYRFRWKLPELSSEARGSR